MVVVVGAPTSGSTVADTALAQWSDGPRRENPFERRGWAPEQPPRYDRGYGPRPRDPLAGMDWEDRKRAIRNEKVAQKRAFKRSIGR